MAGNHFRLRHLAAVLAAALAAQGGVSLALRLRSVHEALRVRLERAFGRPVEVGRFGVSVWTGLRLEAHYITVGEDPQFGNEFLLRADQVSASPDWRALLGGRLLFYKFSFDRPSLNVVRAPDGRWNLQAWTTPPPGSSGVVSRLASPRTGRVDGIVVSNGRINFKRGADKLPFALVGVNGQLSPAADGRWNITLEAQPLRAGVTLQDAGRLRLTGILPPAVLSNILTGGPAGAGPAQFSLEWSRASLSDALRLIAGRDFGVRGSLEASLSAQSPPPAAVSPDARPAEMERETGAVLLTGWKVSGTLRLADVHRWDLPPQPGLPGLNLSVDAAASPDRREWEVREIALEARRSNLHGRAAFGLGENRHAALRVVSASIHLDDLLAWYRAFHPGVQQGTWVEGYLGADVELRGWPLGIVRATFATTGARLNIPGATVGPELHRTVLEADTKGVGLRETQVSLGGGESGVRLSGRASWTTGIPFEASIAGSTKHLAELSTAIAALGLSRTAQPLRAEGSATVRLAWKGSARPWRAVTSGTLALQDAALSGGPLRSDIRVGSARLDFAPAQRRLQISGAKAFGATWTATMSAPTLAGPWQFSLSADRLNPATIVRGFSSVAPANPSLLSRLLPGQPAPAPVGAPSPWPGWLRGEGTVTMGALDVGRLEFERLKGSVIIGEREILLHGAEVSLFGGRVRGEARAQFREQPRYALRADFAGLGVGPLAAVAASTRQCCTGTASGHVDFTAAGWDREALLASLEGAGHAEMRSGALMTLDLPSTLRAAALRSGHTPLRLASGDFLLASGRVQFDRLTLDLGPESVTVQGSANYRGELDVEVVNGGHTPRASPSTTAPRSVRITGTLAAPQIAARPPASP